MIDLSKMVRKLVAVTLFLSSMQGSYAAPVVYDFDTFADGTSLTTQYAGLSFIQAGVLRAGVLLNEIQFPPRSGDGVVFDDGGPINIQFSTPAYSVGGYFTYLNGVTLIAYDSNNVQIGLAAAAFLINLADGSGDPGSSPNEFLEVGSAGGLISRVLILSDPFGGSFVLDDLTVDAAVAIPEPSTSLLMLGLLAAGGLRRGWLRRH